MLNAGAKTLASNFESTDAVLSGHSFFLFSTKPMIIQANIINIGERVLINTEAIVRASFRENFLHSRMRGMRS